jgi:hypothetical protein
MPRIAPGCGDRSVQPSIESFNESLISSARDAKARGARRGARLAGAPRQRVRREPPDRQHEEANMTRRWLIVTLSFIGACGAPGEPVPPATEAHSSALLGAVRYGSDCTATDVSFLDKVMQYGRTAAVTPAFAQCLSRAMSVGAVRHLDGSSIGPYLKCTGDPWYSSGISTQLTEAIQAARSTVDVTIGCTGGLGNASAYIGSYGQLTPETFKWSSWLRNVEGQLSWPVCNGSNGPICRGAEPWPWDQAAGIVWHEAMHQQGYRHGSSESDNTANKLECGYTASDNWNFQWNTLPYLMSFCIGEVIEHSGSVCGAPLESGAGLKLVTDYDGSGCGVYNDPQNATVSWRQIGWPRDANKITACGPNRIYALNNDRTLFVNTSGGVDSGWRYVTAISNTQQIACAGGKLYAFNDDRSLWRNDGTDTAPSWTWVGQPGSARQVTGANQPVTGTPVLYALNDNGGFFMSTSGANGTWSLLGWPTSADRIAVGVGNGQRRPFALNYDKRLFLNAGDGCDSYWHYIDMPTSAVEIAAMTDTSLLALNGDKTLWVGTVNASSWMNTNAFGVARHCNGTSLVP